MTDFAKLKASILKGKKNDTVAMVQAAIDAGESVNDLIDKGMIPAMREIGDKFSAGDAYVPELLVAARAMNSGLALVEPILAASGRQPKGVICIGTVKGDLHDIGKNLVAIMLRGADYKVIDLGVNCDIAKFDEGVAQGATITTMPYMKEIVEHYKGTGIKVIVGGAAVSREFAESIGADGFSSDANEAVKLVDSLMA